VTAAALRTLAFALAATAALAPAACRKPAPRPDPLVFAERVLPVLDRAGCGGGTCHGNGLLPLLFEPGSGPVRAERMRPRLERVIVPGSSGTSLLLAKATGRDHLGGMGVLPGSCEAGVLAAWIDGRPPPLCPPRPWPVRVAPSDAHVPLPPALVRALDGCATAACHGGGSAPRLRRADDPAAARDNGAALAMLTNGLAPSATPLFRRLVGDNGHPALFASPDDPLWRELFAWVTQEPETAAAPAPELTPAGPRPSLAVFRAAVQPLIARRGCGVTACHGGRALPITLLAADEAADDNYLRLLPRARDGLFPAKPENSRPHGGGRRFGGDDDCASRVARAWARGDTEVTPCARRPDPPLDRFAAMVMPNLQRLTCTRCHWQELAGFRLVPDPTGADVEANYRSVLAHIDVDYPAVSSVLQRVREPCMQSRMLAWIGGEREPDCTVDLRNFVGTFPSVPPRSMR
jgi:hypothetical protein